MPADALFLPDGDGTFVPTSAAVGPWDARIVHGAAVVALLAGRLTPAEGTMARVTVDFLRPVPMGPLDLALADLGGGSRARRHRAVLTSDGQEVAAAEAVVIRAGALDLPDRALGHPTPFDATAAPPLDEPNHAAAEIVGHESYDSEAAVFVPMRVEGDRRVHAWISLALPVVAGTALLGTELAAAAADYAQSAVHRQLPFAEWSFRNTEQTIHFARVPVGRWVGLRSEALVQPVGAGFSAADLFDADGWVARTAAAVVVERRPT